MLLSYLDTRIVASHTLVCQAEVPLMRVLSSVEISLPLHGTFLPKSRVSMRRGQNHHVLSQLYHSV